MKKFSTIFFTLTFLIYDKDREYTYNAIRSNFSAVKWGNFQCLRKGINIPSFWIMNSIISDICTESMSRSSNDLSYLQSILTRIFKNRNTCLCWLLRDRSVLEGLRIYFYNRINVIAFCCCTTKTVFKTYGRRINVRPTHSRIVH